MARRPIESDSEQEHEYSDESEQRSEEESEEEEEEEEEEEDSEDEQEKARELAKMKRDLAHVSFEQLAEINNKIESSDQTGKKKISKAQILKDLEGAVGSLNKKKKKDKIKLSKEEMKRENKHRPMEISSKKAVSRFRTVVPLQAEKRRDPRFDKLSGNFNQDLFEKSYGFIKEYNKSEIEMLRERIRKEKDADTQESLKKMLTKMVSAEKMDEDKKRKQALIRERKKKEAELVKQGKKPFFLKKSEKRKLELMDRYQQMGEKAVDRILEKRRKKNTTKDRKRLPFKRRSAE
jgi:ribosomal RNA-processing protein 36